MVKTFSVNKHISTSSLIHLWLRDYLKRSVDIVASFLGLIILSPLFIIIILRIRRESPGSVFYRGQRVGRENRIFYILKFRTMYERSESYNGLRLTTQNDPRVTPVGRWLRDTKLNELPQLWNVLKGDMSLVGPRPEDPEILAKWPVEVKKEILSVRPGMTSPSSVLYRDEEKMLQADRVMDDYFFRILPDKLRLDILYVRMHSFLYDIDILFYTFIFLTPFLRNISLPENILYLGPFTRLIKRHLSWFLIDFVVTMTAIGITGLVHRAGGPLYIGLTTSIGVAVVLALFFSIINSMLGLDRISWRHAKPSYAFDLAGSCGLSTVLLLALNWVIPSTQILPLGIMLEMSLFSYLGFLFIRFRERLLTGLATRWLHYSRRTGAIGERVLIIGAGKCGQLAAWLTRKSKLGQVCTVVGIVDDDPYKQQKRFDGNAVLGTVRDVPSLVQRENIGLILYAMPSATAKEQKRILGICRQTPARVVLVPDLLELFEERILKSTDPVQVQHSKKKSRLSSIH